ncbi:MAG: PEP-CTERM sorting domain-containing protein [Cyanobacteriota bacterium]|nr:PEP-CTERM sorting domain-containing protein [Cyanobacteriota bacterium]
MPGPGCTILFSGINPDGITLTPTDVETGINNEDYSFPLCTFDETLGIFNCGGDPIDDNLGDGTISPCSNLQPGEVCFYSGIGQTAVPEPLTLLGASAAIAFGAGFKRRKSGNG